ncbi:lipase secretion chaperone [Alcanivorax sp. JB21]|uniref:lipase secretion chaperone n=1 Tax=Alcanivorax limicola TaxID=2874102 RepID=UPI001CC00DC6|nr:lipase secretion chaperone [Alcanivorax limicola]MBZ2188194.1 lipase secretion chaperone [Alcanivorax limicola]
MRKRYFGWPAIAVAVLAGVAIVTFWNSADKAAPDNTALSVAVQGGAGEKVTVPVTADQDAGNNALQRRDMVGSDQRFEQYLAAADGLGALPASLDGTEVDGTLRVDARGNLLIENDVRRVFDYFLATLGEEDLQTIRSRIAAYLDDTLPPAAARQAWELFERYEAYGEATEQMPGHDATVAGMTEVLLRQQDLRQEWLGQEVAEAFFGFDDAYDHHTLARMRVAQDPALSDAERAQRLADLEASLPEPLRAVRERANLPVSVSQEVAMLREQGASEHEIRAYREQNLGPAAAQRLEELDRQRAEWDQRYSAYRAQHAEIATSGLSEADRAREIDRLRQALFDETELRRVQALDRSGQ